MAAVTRVIDAVPPPTRILEKKVIVTSRSRTGTFSVYEALKMLGYRPYHMHEIVQQATHMAIFEEALNAKYFGVGKPYGKAEFDKWFAEYDTLVEIPALFIEEMIAFYPEAKFLHMERDVEKWLQSCTNTGGIIFEAVQRFPLNMMRYLDTDIDRFCSLHIMLARVLWHDKSQEDGKVQAKEDYLKLTRQVKELAPKDRLAVFRLEDGFGWKEICPFLEKPIPKFNYPRGNAPGEFHDKAKLFLTPAFKKLMGLAVTCVLVPIAGVSAWYFQLLK